MNIILLIIIICKLLICYVNCDQNPIIDDNQNYVSIPIQIIDHRNNSESIVYFDIKYIDIKYYKLITYNFCRLYSLSTEAYDIIVKNIHDNYDINRKDNLNLLDTTINNILTFPIYLKYIDGEVLSIDFHLDYVNEDINAIADIVNRFCLRYYINENRCEPIYKETFARYLMKRESLNNNINNSSVLHNEMIVHQDSSISTITNNNNVLKAPIYSKFYFPYPTAMLRYTTAVQAELQRMFDTKIMIPNNILKNIEQELLETYLYQSVNDWYNNNSNNIGLYHICMIHSATMIEGSYRILIDLLEHIIRSGLVHKLNAIYVFNYGYIISHDLKHHYPQVIWYEVYEDAGYFEVPTLRIMHKLAHYLQDQSIETNILYLHTKGASYREVYDQIEDWRGVMLYFLVERHEECFQLLHSNEYDCIGINLSLVPARHFGGNFWWTRSDYLLLLPILEYEESGKYEAEMWLLSLEYVRIRLLYTMEDLNPNIQRYPRHCYTNEKPLWISNQQNKNNNDNKNNNECGAYYRVALEMNQSLLIIHE